MIKILYIPSLNIPICYWRIENYADQTVRMKTKAMVNVEYFTDIIDFNLSWSDASVGKGEISKKIQTKLKNAFKFFDIIVFQRLQNMPALALIEELRKEHPNVKIVAELDDSVGEVPPSSPYKWRDHHRWSAEHIYRSDAVICSTQYLADSIKSIVGNKPIHIAPNCINNRTWKFNKPKKNHEGIRIGYVGGGAHDEDIRIVYRAILPILDESDYVKLVIRYGGWKPKWLEDHRNIDFKSVAWSIDEYPQKLADMDLDLALAPLRDSEFNRCKSNLKWLEWGSMNIPLMASNVEPYKKTKGNMILVDNNIHFWSRAIRDFINNPIKINDSGLRKDVLKNYNLYGQTNKLVSFFKSLL